MWLHRSQMSLSIICLFFIILVSSYIIVISFYWTGFGKTSILLLSNHLPKVWLVLEEWWNVDEQGISYWTLKVCEGSVELYRRNLSCCHIYMDSWYDGLRLSLHFPKWHFILKSDNDHFHTSTKSGEDRKRDKRLVIMEIQFQKMIILGVSRTQTAGDNVEAYFEIMKMLHESLSQLLSSLAVISIATQ